MCLARHLSEPRIEWRALLFSTVIASFTGDLDNAEDYGRRALACARAAGDPLCQGHALLALGVVARIRTDYAAAESLTTEALRLARRGRDIWHEAWALASSGHLALAQGAYKGAQEFLEAGRAAVREWGDPPELTGWIFDGLAEIAAASGEFQQARAWLVKSLELRYDAGELDVMAITLGRLAAVEAVAAQPELALRLAGAADGLYAALGMPRQELERQRLERWLPAARNRLSVHVADVALAEGGALSLEEAIALARSGLASIAPGNDIALRPLTAREQEVAALLAHRLTNRQIAARLGVAERTVAAHIEHILDKLGFASRHQVAAWMVEHNRPLS